MKLLHFRFNVGFSDGKVKLESPAILSPPLSLQCPMWKVGLGKRTEERFPDSRKSNAALSPSSSSLTGGRLSRSGTAEDRSTGLREPPRDTTDRPLLPKRPPCCHSTTLITTQTSFATIFPQIEVRGLLHTTRSQRRALSSP